MYAFIEGEVCEKLNGSLRDHPLPGRRGKIPVPHEITEDRICMLLLRAKSARS